MSNDIKKSFRIVSDVRQNAKTWANKFDARMLLAGTVSYEDVGCGKALLTHETIDACKDTFIGRPLILTDRLSHKSVSPETMEREAKGYIDRVYFDPSDGWFHCSGIVFNDQTKDAINKIGLVSCAYKVLKAGEGGERNAIKYDEEILEFSGEHLAIVANPRYEGATIRLNSKQPNKTNMSLFKFWKKSAPAAGDEGKNADGTVKENAVTPLDISPESEIELSDGKKATVAQLVEAYNAKSKEGLEGDEEVVINGKPVKMNDLVAAYNKMNSDDEEKKTKDNARIEKERADKDKDKADADAEKAKGSKENEKKEPNYFRILTTARENSVFSDGVKVSAGTMDERIATGKERYGKKTV